MALVRALVSICVAYILAIYSSRKPIFHYCEAEFVRFFIFHTSSGAVAHVFHLLSWRNARGNAASITITSDDARNKTIYLPSNAGHLTLMIAPLVFFLSNSLQFIHSVTKWWTPKYYCAPRNNLIELSPKKKFKQSVLNFVLTDTIGLKLVAFVFSSPCMYYHVNIYTSWYLA